MAAVSLPVYLGFEHYSAFSAMLRNPHAGELKRMMATMLEIAVVGGVGFAAYAATAKALKLSELESASAMIKGKFRRKRA
jgi:preprotein translocase subunit Sss1